MGPWCIEHCEIIIKFMILISTNILVFLMLKFSEYAYTRYVLNVCKTSSIDAIFHKFKILSFTLLGIYDLIQIIEITKIIPMIKNIF